MDGIDTENPLDVALRIAAVLDENAIPYALGGALAYGLWAIPRATNDVNINVFVDEARFSELFDVLAIVGIRVEPVRARAAAERDGLIVTSLGGYRVDLFVPSIDFSWEAERTRVRHTIGERSAWFLSAEAIAVFKLLFFRGKDLVDLERLVAVQKALDTKYVRDRIVEMLGEDEDRVRRWDRIVAGGPAVE